MRTHKEIAEGILGYAIDDQGYAPCPGRDSHSTASGERDWRIWFDENGKPHEHCFHHSCQGARDEFMRVLYRAIAAEERGSKGVTKRSVGQLGNRPLPAVPQERKAVASDVDEEMVDNLASRMGDEVVNFEYLRSRSAVAIPKDSGRWGKLLLDALYVRGSKILVFTAFRSQGDFMYEVGGKLWRLGRKPGVQAVESPRWPKGGECGVWFLCAPVTGEWEASPNKKDREGNLLPGRRHGGCCCGFPYIVIESDEVDEEKWLRILVQLADPIVAVYTSGGKSVHALVRVDAATKAEFNMERERFIKRLSCVGADVGAMSAVRLTRLPGCLRHGKENNFGKVTKYEKPRMQELLYLNPNAVAGKSIMNMPVRKGGAR